MRVRCVGAIAKDSSGRFLLIRRANPPGEGLWSLPGGRIEPGESDISALVREVREETGLSVAVGALVGSVERPGPGDVVYEIDDYAASLTGGELRAGDDASDARWVAPSELARLPLTDGLLDALAAWNLI